MTLATSSQPADTDTAGFINRYAVGLQALGIIAMGLVLAAVFDWARVWPLEWTIPFKAWISEFFRWLDKEATFGLFTVKEVTRTFSWALKQPLIWSEYLLWKGAKPGVFLPVFWLLAALVIWIVVRQLRDAKTALWVAGSILGLVIIDAFPFILESLTKSLRKDPLIEPVAFIGFSQWPVYLLDALTPGSKLKQVPWIAVVAGFVIFGHWVGGIKLAVIVAICMGYLAVTGLWRESMKTFSLVIVAVPFSAALGLWLGIIATRSKRAANMITPFLDRKSVV